MCFCVQDPITSASFHLGPFKECVSTGEAGAHTRRSLGHHLLNPLILTLLVLCGSANFEAQSSLLQNRLHPQMQIPNLCPAFFQVKASRVRFYRHLVIKAKTMPTPLLNLKKMEKNTLLPRPDIHSAIHLLPCEQLDGKCFLAFMCAL